MWLKTGGIYCLLGRNIFVFKLNISLGTLDLRRKKYTQKPRRFHLFQRRKNSLATISLLGKLTQIRLLGTCQEMKGPCRHNFLLIHSKFPPKLKSSFSNWERGRRKKCLLFGQTDKNIARIANAVPINLYSKVTM